MGISLNPLAYLIRNKNYLGNTVVFGRQWVNLYEESEEKINKMFASANIDYDYRSAAQHRFADELFLKLGADAVTWFDYSDYEGATLIHDLNQELPNATYGFDTVVDGGTIEHVFNVPMAFKNVNKLLKRHGHFITLSPANNWLGHGMYQFSPELFWSGLSSCGFDVKDVTVMLRDGSLDMHVMPDPRVDGVRREINIKSHARVDIFTLSEKLIEINNTDNLGAQQSDYVSAWTSNKSTTYENE